MNPRKSSVDHFAVAIAASKFRRLSSANIKDVKLRDSAILKTGNKQRQSAGFVDDLVKSSSAITTESSTDGGATVKRFKKAVLATMQLANRRVSDPVSSIGMADLVKRRGTLANGINSKRKSAGDFTVRDQRLVNAIHKAAQERKRRLLRKFQITAKAIGYMIHLSQKVQVDSEESILFRAEMKRLTEAIAANDSGQVPLINRIDTSYYKANTQMRMSTEGKRILSKHPKNRTEKDIQYATIALRNVKTIADYPLHIQQQLATYGFFECYEPKRIIVKEGRPSENYYILIYGQVMFAKMDAGNMAKRLGSLYRGYYFGELGIYNGTPRQSSIITEEYTELLRVSDVDFKRIFMGGDISRNPEEDSFLRHVTYLKGWPIHVLKGNRKAIMTTYFQREAVMTRDSNLSEWIYIVKSGSIRVMKKLLKTEANTSKRTGLHKKLANCDGYSAFLSTEDEYQRFILYNNIETPPPLTRNGDQESVITLTREDTSLTLPLMLKLQRACRPRTAWPDHSSFSSKRSKRRMSVSWSSGYERSPSSLTRGTGSYCFTPHIQSPRNGATSASSSQEVASQTGSVTNKKDEGRRTIFDDWDAATKNQTKPLTEADLNPQFVQVQTLTKGQVFGLQYILYKDQPQPSFIVISNGAECVKLNRKIFEDHLTYTIKTDLLKMVPPYPTDEYLQERLVTQMNWESYKHILINNMRREQTKENFGRYSYKCPKLKIK